MSPSNTLTQPEARQSALSGRLPTSEFWGSTCLCSSVWVLGMHNRSWIILDGDCRFELMSSCFHRKHTYTRAFSVTWVRNTGPQCAHL